MAITQTDPDYIPLVVANRILGGGSSGRLFQNIREQKGYTYGIYSSLNAYPHGSFLEIGAEVGTQVREQTLHEIQHEINLLRTTPIQDEELQTVKNYMSGNILRKIDGPLKFSETLKSLLIYNQPIHTLHTLLQTIQTITAPELQTLANQYLDYEQMHKITVG